MRILQLAPLFHPITEDITYGGIERVVSSLADEQSRQGHECFLSASEGSRSKATLLPVATDTPSPYEEQAAVALELARAGKIDVIHAHRRDFLRSAAFRRSDPSSMPPVLVTLHGPAAHLAHKYRDVSIHRKVFFNGLSAAQAAGLAELFELVGTIHNGVDTRLYTPSKAEADHLLFLGRIAPEKGPDLAIELARAVHERIVLAGVVLPQDRPFFEQRVRPLLEYPGAELVGPVNDREKRTYLARAKALVLPVRWEDPCPLVALEALACGIPVLALSRGGLPEIVTHGESGYLAEDVEQLHHAARLLHRLDRRQCRRRAEDFFSLRAWARNYVALYSTLGDRARQRQGDGLFAALRAG